MARPQAVRPARRIENTAGKPQFACSIGAGTVMGPAETAQGIVRRNKLRSILRGASLALGIGLLGAGAPGHAAGLLGGSHGGPLPNLAPLPTPGTGAVPALGSGSTPDKGTIIGPSLSIPLSPPAVGSLNTPLAVPDVGSTLPTLSPELKDLSNNLRQNLSTATGTAQPIRRGFTLPPPDERRFVSNEVVLNVPAIPAPALDAIAVRHRLTLTASRSVAVTGRMLYRWRIDDGRSVAEVIPELAGEQGIAAAQPNFTFALQQQAAAPAAASEGDPAQYAVAKLRLAEAHRFADGKDVLVALIDTAVDGSHPELAGVIAASHNEIGGNPRPDPHGTAMAGAIAAHGRLIGVAPRARLLAVRAFGTGPSEEATTFAILVGLDWAIEHGARIVNMSFAGPADPALQEALAKARKKGVVLIAAAGNAGPKSPPLYPAADPNVIAVTATDADDRLFAQANRGSHVALAAPGVDILAPAPDAAMQLATGTSIAAAHVSGIAALMIERKPALRPEEVRKILVSTAKRLGAKPRDNDFGAGLADALDAVSALAPKAAAK
jgi:subtilisin family serine protease